MDIGATARVERESRPRAVETRVRCPDAHLAGNDARAGEKRIAFATLDRLHRAEPRKDHRLTRHDVPVDGQQIAGLDGDLLAGFERDARTREARISERQGIRWSRASGRGRECFRYPHPFDRDRLTRPFDELKGQSGSGHDDAGKRRGLVGRRIVKEPGCRGDRASSERWREQKRGMNVGGLARHAHRPDDDADPSE
jgi:hypothetical protein